VRWPATCSERCDLADGTSEAADAPIRSASPWKPSGEEVLPTRDVHPTTPPVVQVSERARAELREGEALVFDWIRLAVCCAVAGEVSLRRTTRQEARSSAAFVPLPTEDATPVFAHRRAYPLLAGRHLRIDCRRRLGMRRFSSSLPHDLGLRSSFGRPPRPSPDDPQPGRPNVGT
jgi:hypothetical protein